MSNSVPRPKEQILSVGTDPTVKKILKLGFADSDYQYLNLTTAQEAFGYLANNRVAYLIVETHLADIRGLQFAREVKKRLPEAYILVLTDYLDLEETIQALEGVIDEYLLKPIRFEQVLSIIKRFSRLQSLQAIIAEKTQRIRELEAENKSLYAKLQEIYPNTQVMGNQPAPVASQQRQMQALSSYAQHIQKGENEEQ